MTKPSRQSDYRRDRHALRHSLTMALDLNGLDALIDELGENAREAIRPASQAAAQVLYDEVKANAERIKKKSGNLASSIYQVYSTMLSGPSNAVYHVSWNSKKAPHGGLVEYGHLQRYRYYKGADGQIRPMVRPGMDGKPRPKGRASQAEKDAYYIPLPTPIQVPARPFVRPAIDKFEAAMKAAEAELRKRILDGKK